MHFRVILWLFGALGLAVSCNGCRNQPVLEEVERDTGYRIMKLLKLYETAAPGVHVTNVLQLFAGLNKPYPHDWDARFRRFDKHAGFTNSIFEKYVFFQSGLNIRGLDGELLLLNTQPFPNREGKKGRMVITKPGRQDLRYQMTWIAESRLQGFLEVAGIQMPKPVAMPVPPPALPMADERPSWSARVSEFFTVQADWLGIPGRGWLLQWIVTGVLFVLFGAVVFGLFWFGRHKRAQ